MDAQNTLSATKCVVTGLAFVAIRKHSAAEYLNARFDHTEGAAIGG